MRQNAVINKRPHGCVFKIFKYVNAVFFRVNFAVGFIVDFDHIYSYFVVAVLICITLLVDQCFLAGGVHIVYLCGERISVLVACIIIYGAAAFG